MLYKTISLHLLEQRPQLLEQLRSQRTVLETVNRLASELRESHLSWMNQFTTGSESQRASEAMELALRDLEASLPPDSPQDEQDSAMAVTLSE